VPLFEVAGKTEIQLNDIAPQLKWERIGRRMYSVMKFPEYEREAWIAENKELINQQLKFEGLSKEAVQNALEQVMAEYIYLSNVTKEVEEWKRNFARFLAYAVNTSESKIEQSKGGDDFDGGRLSMIKEVLEWF
jgi:hypothetical protein